jgi:hypothetical protein
MLLNKRTMATRSKYLLRDAKHASGDERILAHFRWLEHLLAHPRLLRHDELFSMIQTCMLGLQQEREAHMFAHEQARLAAYLYNPSLPLGDSPCPRCVTCSLYTRLATTIRSIFEVRNGRRQHVADSPSITRAVSRFLTESRERFFPALTDLMEYFVDHPNAIPHFRTVLQEQMIQAQYRIVDHTFEEMMRAKTECPACPLDHDPMVCTHAHDSYRDDCAMCADFHELRIVMSELEKCL